MKSGAIAIVGMSGRFPGARNLSNFWQNLRDGVESVRRLTDTDLLSAGVTAEEIADPDYVKASAVLDDVAMFDAAFFGFSPRDAAIMDPQHRHFLECAWEALEDAGHPPQQFDGAIGVYAGSGLNSYLIHNLLANRQLRETAGLFQLKQTGNDKDVLSTRVSYQLNLRGPSINIQTACSTSLVAVHIACQSLLNLECDMALAGGVTIEIPHAQGYVYREGEILSRDGHCRAFDAASSGTVFGSGLGLVVLRRLEDAVADHDNIRAVILGSAINNDGARKVGYLAPSVEGQADVVAEAQAVAGVTADDISYVETHGTGTAVGDPIEIRALARAFAETNRSQRAGYCGIGSLKTNIGHLDAAAGVSGLIKTVLALEHRQIPASLHFVNPNPLIEFSGSPFYVNSRLSDWKSDGPRRAGVTALGIGGTNAHVVVEEAPAETPGVLKKPCHVLTLSAKTESALRNVCAQLAGHLREHPGLNLVDVAFTSQVGRQAFAHRYTVVAHDVAEAADALASADRKETSSHPSAATKAPGVTFLFSGQGSQYLNMGRELYETEPAFREPFDLCAERLKPHLGVDLRHMLYPAESSNADLAAKLGETWLTQPALVALEYSLARWWMSLGVEPQTMVGHSIGEYVAACLAGVLSLDDVLKTAAIRGRLIFELPAGAMLAIPLAAAEVKLPPGLSLAAVNHPRQCVVSGPTLEIEKFEAELEKQSVACRRLHTSHAFHSAMMESILERFVQHMQTIALAAPKIPYLSNVTGTWITPEQATDPRYWARHLRETVRFSDGLEELFRQQPDGILLEVGPGQVLASLARQQSPKTSRIFQSLRHPQENISDARFALRTLGELWMAGVSVDWKNLHPAGSARRISLPTYPFEHKRFWVDPDVASSVTLSSPAPALEDQSDSWFYRRVWKPAPLNNGSLEKNGCCLIFSDSSGLGDQLARELKAKGQKVLQVTPGPGYRRLGSGNYEISSNSRSDYDALVADVFKNGDSPKKIVHLWAVSSGTPSPTTELLNRTFYSLLFLAQALAEQDRSGLDVVAVSSNLQSVSGEAVSEPARAALLGPVRVIPKELPGITCRAIDLDPAHDSNSACVAAIISEIAQPASDAAIAYRRGERFIESVEPLKIAAHPPERSANGTEPQRRPRLVKNGVYLLTGGLGGIGLTVAEQLAKDLKARLVLVGRSAFPPEAEWETCLRVAGTSEATKRKIRKLMELKSLGAELLILKADVCEPSGMREVLDRTRAQWGKLHGVFHAAGLADDRPLMLKTPEDATKVLDPKIPGTLVLEEVLRDVPLDCFVLFSSVSSFLAPAGQVDYAAANSFLDAFALSRGGPVMAIDWSLWREVGLGAAFLHPLIEHRLSETSNERIYSSQFSQQRQWVLAEHRFKNGKALIPGTGYLEMAAAAFERGALRHGIEFEDVYFLAPLTFNEAEEKEVRVQLKREGNGSRFSIQAGGERKEHSTGGIGWLKGTRPAPLDLGSISARCSKREIKFDDQHRTKQEGFFNFGPRWRSLKTLRVGDHEGLAELELPAGLMEENSRWRVHPALLDMATGCALYLIEGYGDSPDLYLPVSYKKLRSYSPIPAKVYSYIRSRSENTADREMAVFDITLFDEQGQVVADAEGFTMRRVSEQAVIAAATAETRISASTDPSPLGSHESLGIPPLEGARALIHILASDTPSVVVVSPQYPGVQAIEAPRVAQKAATATPPADEVEATLSKWWRDLLGVEQVGLDDDFFDLGGHSLIAVRLIAKIKKTFHVDLGLATLFESRTIHQLADLIRKQSQPNPSEVKAWSPLVPVQPLGSKTPLFLVHGLGPSILFYKALAKHLGADQPVYGLQSPLTQEDQPVPESIEQLASIYVKEIRRFLPGGPYLIGGASLGGLIAVEIARQLHAQGIEPERLLLLDASVPGSHKVPPTSQYLRQHFQNLWRAGSSYFIRSIKAKVGYYAFRSVRNATSIICRIYRAAGWQVPPGFRYVPVEEAHERLMSHYRLAPYPGKVTLMRAIDFRRTVGTVWNPTLGWDNYAAGGLEIHDVPGEHNSMLREPNVRILAETLKSVLAATASARWSKSIAS